MLANIFNYGNKIKVKHYYGTHCNEVDFNTYDEAVNDLIMNGYKLKAINEDINNDYFSMWFEA